MPFFSNTLSVAKHVILWITSSGHGDAVHHCTTHETKQNNEEEIAIYCIHGIFDQSSAFSFIANNIKSQLPKEVSSIHQLSFNGRFQLKDIVYFANQLKDKIKANKPKKVIL